MKVSSAIANLIKVGFIAGKMSTVNIAHSVCDIQRVVIIYSVSSLKINFLPLYLLELSSSHG